MKELNPKIALLVLCRMLVTIVAADVEYWTQQVANDYIADGTELHDNVTAYDMCMYLAIGYEANIVGNGTVITTEAYFNQATQTEVILTRLVNDIYDRSLEVPKGPSEEPYPNFNTDDCDNITDVELGIMHFGAQYVRSVDHDGSTGEEALLPRMAAANNYCLNEGENCLHGGTADPTWCDSYSQGWGFVPPVGLHVGLGQVAPWLEMSAEGRLPVHGRCWSWEH